MGRSAGADRFAAVCCLYGARRTSGVERARLVLTLDGLVIVGSLLIFTWATALGTVVRAGAPTGLGFAVAIAYPITDLILVVIVVLLLATRPVQPRLRGSMVRIAADLGITVVAEGVETPEQAAALARLGCGFGQGHVYGRPAPMATMAPPAALVAQERT
jgi:predicted signal transduction protein with EAL and GGDEF domain